jgi:macrolide-specific efflux system membrane fusion protein
LVRGEPLAVPSVLLKVVEQAEVPSQVAGVLTDVQVREGQVVKAGDALAQIEDQEARSLTRAAALELDAARKQAGSDVKPRFARKAREVAEAELKRAEETAARVAKSVSQTELAHLKLVMEKAELEIEQADLDRELAQMAASLKENELAAAEQGLSRRRILAPLDGVVAQVHARRGEWVEPGKTLLRIVRVDRLRAEGLVNVNSLSGELVGADVSVKVVLGKRTEEVRGKLVFISPEADPVSGQVRVWAEIDNPGLALRAGQRGSMVISPPADQTTSK